MQFLLLILFAALSNADILSDLSLLSELIVTTDIRYGTATKTSNLGFSFPTDLPTKPPAPVPSLNLECQGRGCPIKNFTTGKKIAVGVAVPVGILLAIIVVYFGRKYGKRSVRKAQAAQAQSETGVGRSEDKKYGVWVRDEGKGT